MTDKHRNITGIIIPTATYGLTGRNPHMPDKPRKSDLAFKLVVAILIAAAGLLIMAWGFGLWTLP